MREVAVTLCTRFSPSKCVTGGHITTGLTFLAHTGGVGWGVVLCWSVPFQELGKKQILWVSMWVSSSKAKREKPKWKHEREGSRKRASVLLPPLRETKDFLPDFSHHRGAQGPFSTGDLPRLGGRIQGDSGL